MQPIERDGMLRNANSTTRIVRAGAAVTAGWLGLAMLAASPALAERGKPPRPFPKYTVEVIHGVECPFVGYEPISGRSISAAGVVAGQLTACPQNKEAFLYPTGGGGGGGPLFIMPRPPGFSNAYGADVNDLNWLVGRITQSGVNQQGFVYKPDGSLTLIPPPPEGDWCEATGVNNAGVAVGWWANITTGPHRKAYRWENGVRTDLTMLRGPKSEAFDISESGLITGWTGNSSLLDACAFILSEDGTVTELPPLPGGTSSMGYSINDHGDICGRSRIFIDELGSYRWRAFAYIDGEMIAIPPLPGFTDHTSARGINSHGQVVGGSGFGFIWQDNAIASLQDLVVGPPDLQVSTAWAISDDGRIVTGGSDAQTYLLTPIIPPPGDLDGDGFVNGIDVTILIGAWGRCPATCPVDIDGNGVVNGFDLAMLLASWGPL